MNKEDFKKLYPDVTEGIIIYSKPHHSKRIVKKLTKKAIKQYNKDADHLSGF